jgi:succinyl-diaminopimelate desuccinylase
MRGMESIRKRVVALTQELVRRSKPSGDDDGGQQLIAERLQRLGFDIENVSVSNCDNLLAVRGSGSEFFSFLGHTDVVPAGTGWSVDPFRGAIVGDRLLGRGVADMKGSIAAWIVALEDFLAINPHSMLPMVVLISGDEEGIAQGAPALLKRLASRGQRLRSCLVGEPSASGTLGDCVRVGRRGSVSARVRVVGVQGHVAYPHLAKNPIHAASKIISRLTSIDFDEGLPAVRSSVLDEGWPKSSLQCSGFQAGIGGTLNLIPGEALFRFNIRFRPPLTREKVIESVGKVLDDSDLKVEVEWTGGTKPYDSSPGPLRASVLAALASRNLTPRIARDGGTSDGRYVAESGAEVLELGPCNETIHKVDEGLDISELTALVNLYGDIIRKVEADW